MSYYRMAEHRRLRADLIRRSTGPRMEEVKATSSRNGYKGGERQTLRALAKLLYSFAVDTDDTKLTTNGNKRDTPPR